jgi:hypothetical protein
LAPKAISSTGFPRRYAVYLLYWYRSTNTDAERQARRIDVEVPLLSLEEAYAIKNIDVLGFKTITIDCTMPYADAKTPPGRQVTHTSAYVSMRH